MRFGIDRIRDSMDGPVGHCHPQCACVSAAEKIFLTIPPFTVLIRKSGCIVFAAPGIAQRVPVTAAKGHVIIINKSAASSRFIEIRLKILLSHEVGIGGSILNFRGGHPAGDEEHSAGIRRFLDVLDILTRGAITKRRNIGIAAPRVTAFYRYSAMVSGVVDFRTGSHFIAVCSRR